MVSMRRRAFTIISLFSLLLCLAAAFMWGRSHVTAPEAIEWVRRNDAARSLRFRALTSGGGSVCISSHWMDAPSMPIYVWRDAQGPGQVPTVRYGRAEWSPADPSPYRAYPGGWYFAGFGWQRRSLFLYSSAAMPQSIGGQWAVAVPWWSVAAAAAVAPGTWLVRRRRRRHRPGFALDAATT
jgi:hypothetical protein